MELLDVGALGVSSVDGGSLDDRQVAGTNAMPATHLLVELLNSTVEGGVAVLLVCIVHTSAGVVTHPDTVVLDAGRVALENLVNCENLAVGLLHTPEFTQEVPEIIEETNKNEFSGNYSEGRRRSSCPTIIIMILPIHDFLIISSL